MRRTCRSWLNRTAVTGWKALWVNRYFTKRIVELSHDESEVLLKCALA